MCALANAAGLPYSLVQFPTPMNRRPFIRLLLLVAALTLAPLAVLAQTQAGAIKAVLLRGTVAKIPLGGTTPVPLTEGAALIETDTIITDKDSGAVLVFANGSSVKLGASSRLAIEEFKMDPLGDDIAVAALQREPNVSKTRLNLAYGEVVGNVKKLNKDRGSSFDIKTPVGAAGIRGTTFRIVMRFEANGQITFTLSTAEGTVRFSGSVQVSSGTTTQTGTTQETDVSDGQQVNAVATINPTTNQVSGVQVSATQPITAEEVQAITIAVTQGIQQAQQTTTFTTTEQQQAAQQTNTTQQSGTTGTSDSTKTEQKTEGQTTTQTLVIDVVTRSGSG